MADRYLICPLCGFEFEKVDTVCGHGCPFLSSCNLTRCPSCDFEFPEEPRPLSWLRRLFSRRGEAAEDRCEQFRTVGDLSAGETAEVLSLTGGSARRNTLAVFGLAPGSEVTLLQRSPAFVVRIGETELALDAEIAREILIRSPSDDSPVASAPAE